MKILYSRKFASINFHKSPTNMAEKKIVVFISATRSRCLTTPPTIFRMEMVTHSVYFQRRNDSKTSKRVGRCQQKTAIPKGGSKLWGSIRSCSELIVGREKFPQFAWCFYDKIDQLSVNLLDLRLEGTVFNRKFVEEQFFTSWCLIAKIAKIFYLAKIFPLNGIYQHFFFYFCQES